MIQIQIILQMLLSMSMVSQLPAFDFQQPSKQLLVSHLQDVQDVLVLYVDFVGLHGLLVMMMEWQVKEMQRSFCFTLIVQSSPFCFNQFIFIKNPALAPIIKYFEAAVSLWSY
eukprot:NODE_890_length_3281_cov_0.434318.p5 type:complete len:113 gc:universal NODE_890_length_3281_cov_0.434318:1590-1252(-)